MKKYLALLTILLVSCQAAPVSPSISIDTIIMESDFTPPSEPEVGWGNDGPYEQRLLSAWSDNGVEWQRSEKVITEQANVPDMILNDDGQIMLYYTGGNIDGEEQAMAVAVSDKGESWLFKKVIINNQPEGTSAGGDPDIVRLDNGNYRLYYTAQIAGDSSPGILYADSENGIIFDYQGQAFYSEGDMIMDSTTFYADNQWVMITLNGGERSLVHTSSSDGREFTKIKEEEVSFAGTPYFLSNHLETDDGVLMYGFNLQEGISTFFSTTGLEWTESRHTDLSLDGSSAFEDYYLKDPAIVQLDDGSYFMVYVSRYPDSEGISDYEPTIDTTFLSTDVYCEDEECFNCSKKLYSDGTEVNLGYEMYCDTSLWNSMNSFDTRYAYWEDYTLKLFDYATQSSKEMMSVRDDTEGASIFWSPSGDRLAVVTMNWNYEGDKTKVFILDLDHKGRLVDKHTHLLKVRYSCHAAGCNVLDGSFRFEDEDTLRYYTFIDDPYDDETSTLQSYDL